MLSNRLQYIQEIHQLQVRSPPISIQRKKYEAKLIGKMYAWHFLSTIPETRVPCFRNGASSGNSDSSLAESGSLVSVSRGCATNMAAANTNISSKRYLEQFCRTHLGSYRYCWFFFFLSVHANLRPWLAKADDATCSRRKQLPLRSKSEAT